MVPLLAVVIAFGMLGGFVSLQQRIQSVPSTGDPIVNIADLANSQFSLYLAPISGAVFAGFLKETGPDSGISLAMLLVWSFIAGFAERFVPDTIDRLVSQAAKK